MEEKLEEMIPEQSVPEDIPAEEPQEMAAAEEIPAAEEAPVAVAPKKQPKIKKKRPLILSLLAWMVVFALCIAMFVVTLTGALVLDLRVMTSQGGLEKLVSQLITPSLSEVPAIRMDESIPVQGETVENVTGALVDFVYAQLEQQFGEEIPVTKDAVNQFLEESTAKEFLVEKVSGAVTDFVNGTNETTISAKEVAELLRENAPLVKEAFNVEVTEDTIKKVEEQLKENPLITQMEQQGIAGVLEETLEKTLDETLKDSGLGEVLESSGLGEILGTDGSGGVAETLSLAKKAMAMVRMLISNQVILAFAVALLVLILLVFLLNWSIPKSLSDVGFVMLFAGLILSAPNLLLAGNSQQLAVMLGSGASLISGFLASVAVVHYSILGAGLGLIFLAIVAKIIKSAAARKREAALAAA